MKITVDTNILIRSARQDDDPVESRIARDLLVDATLVVVPTLTLCEFDWVMRKRYKRPRDEVIASIRAVINGPTTAVDTEAVSLGLVFLQAGGDFADGVIAFEGRRLGGEAFASFDAKAKRIAAAAGFAVI